MVYGFLKTRRDTKHERTNHTRKRERRPMLAGERLSKKTYRVEGKQWRGTGERRKEETNNSRVWRAPPKILRKVCPRRLFVFHRKAGVDIGGWGGGGKERESGEERRREESKKRRVV